MPVVWLKAVDATYPRVRRNHVRLHNAALTEFFTDQRRVVRARFRNGIFDLFGDWEHDLFPVVFTRNREVARDFGGRVADELRGKQGFDPDLMDPWLTTNARIATASITDSVEDDVNAALVDGSEGIDAVFDVVMTVGVALWSTSMVTTAANFGAHDAARGMGARSKTWQVNSSDPRSEHAALNGETVPLTEPFSNGMMWPGDPDGGAENNANCACSVVFN